MLGLRLTGGQRERAGTDRSSDCRKASALRYDQCRNVRASCEDSFHDFAEIIGEPEIPAVVTIRQPGVIEAQQVQDRRVQIVDVHFDLCTAFAPNSSVAP